MIEVNHGIRTTTDQTFTQVKQSTDAIINRVRLLTSVPELVIEQFLNDVVADFCKKTWILQKTIEVGDEIEGEPDLYENNFLSGPDEDPFSISNSDFISPGINYSLYQSNEDYRGRVTSMGFSPISLGYEMSYAALQFSGIGDSVSADIAWMGEEMVDLCIFLKADIPNDQYTGWKCQTVGVGDVGTLGVLPYNGTAGTNETAVADDWMAMKKLRCVASLKDDTLSILLFVDDVQQYQRSISVSTINTDTILIYFNNRVAIQSLKITGVTSS